MIRFSSTTLRQIGCSLFEAAGCSPSDAQLVVNHLVESSLFGLDSHGTLRFYEYLQLFKNGACDPKGTPTVLHEAPCTALVDGNSSLGQVGATFATELAIRKAQSQGMASVALRNCGHIGRVGAYPLMAARAGLIGIAWANAGRLGYQVAPFGGLDGRLSTNPVAFAAPRHNADPLMVDVPTAAISEGKVRMALNRGDRIPEGWLRTHDGRPTTDPKDLISDPPGALSPLGGISAHKGYCLSMMVEILGGALSGQGCAAGERSMKSNGLLITVYDIGHFAKPEDYDAQVEQLIRHVRSSRIDPKIGEILLPGEPEFRTQKKREAEGIQIDPTTWSRICDAARSVGLNPAPWEDQAMPD